MKHAAGGGSQGGRRFTFEYRRPWMVRVGNRDGCKQRSRVGVSRPCEHVFGSSLFDDFPEVHDAHGIRQLPDDREVMGNEQKSDAQFFHATRGSAQ